jgi:hypothetical protein
MTSSTLPGSEGPLPYSRWLTGNEYKSARDLALKLTSGMHFEGVTMWADFPSPFWRVLSIPFPDNPHRNILIALPLVDGEYGPTQTNAFFLVGTRAVVDGFESVGDILRRMRGEVESQMTDTFDRSLSLQLDQLLDQEHRRDEGYEL